MFVNVYSQKTKILINFLTKCEFIKYLGKIRKRAKNDVLVFEKATMAFQIEHLMFVAFSEKLESLERVEFSSFKMIK